MGKSTVARGLAKHYNIRWISGGDVLKEMARERGLDPDGDNWWDTPQGMSFLRMREQDFELDRQVDNRLLKMCQTGNVVVTSYTLPWLDADAQRVWLECSPLISATRMQNRDGVGADEAMKVAQKRHKHNTELYRRHYGFHFGMDESVFDIVVHTNNKDAEQVVAEVVTSLERM